MTNRDLENIDVSAAFFDANDPMDSIDTARINIPEVVLERYQPMEMEIQGPFDDGSFLVGLRLVPRNG